MRRHMRCENLSEGRYAAASFTHVATSSPLCPGHPRFPSALFVICAWSSSPPADIHPVESAGRVDLPSDVLRAVDVSSADLDYAENLPVVPAGPPRGPNQLVCRSVKTVDEVVLAWEVGLNGYGPMKDYKNGAGGKLDRAQINLLSKANTVYKKVIELGRDGFRRVYETPVKGKPPTLGRIRTPIEKENSCQARERKRAVTGGHIDSA